VASRSHSLSYVAEVGRSDRHHPPQPFELAQDFCVHVVLYAYWIARTAGEAANHHEETPNAPGRWAVSRVFSSLPVACAGAWAGTDSADTGARDVGSL